MAGIGFELRKLLRKDSLLGLVQAYAYAGVIGSGPWVLSIVGMLLIGFLSASVVVPLRRWIPAPMPPTLTLTRCSAATRKWNAGLRQ